MGTAAPRRNRRCRRVLELEPIRRSAGTIDRVLALRHNVFESHLAGVGEDGRAVAFHVLVEAQAKAGFGQHASKRGLAHFQRSLPSTFFLVCTLFDFGFLSATLIFVAPTCIGLSLPSTLGLRCDWNA